MKISLIQMNSQPDRQLNLKEAWRLMEEACATEKPDLIVLPEHFDWTGGTSLDKRAAADLVPAGEAYELVRRFARDKGVAVHAGSLLERRAGEERIYNTTVIFDADGRDIGRYRKIHLFDITTPDGKLYAESATVTAGSSLMIYEIAGFRIGCAICYDLRFSRLFDRLASVGVDAIILPAAFTAETGRAHWEVLCRARAIEFQCFFIACGQCGSYLAPGHQQRSMFGHSLVVDPWGSIIAAGANQVGRIEAHLDKARLDDVRRMIPMQDHRVAIHTLPVCISGQSG